MALYRIDHRDRTSSCIVTNLLHSRIGVERDSNMQHYLLFLTTITTTNNAHNLASLIYNAAVQRRQSLFTIAVTRVILAQYDTTR